MADLLHVSSPETIAAQLALSEGLGDCTSVLLRSLQVLCGMVSAWPHGCRTGGVSIAWWCTARWSRPHLMHVLFAYDSDSLSYSTVLLVFASLLRPSSRCIHGRGAAQDARELHLASHGNRTLWPSRTRASPHHNTDNGHANPKGRDSKPGLGYLYLKNPSSTIKSKRTRMS